MAVPYIPRFGFRFMITFTFDFYVARCSAEAGAFVVAITLYFVCCRWRYKCYNLRNQGQPYDNRTSKRQLGLESCLKGRQASLVSGYGSYFDYEPARFLRALAG